MPKIMEPQIGQTCTPSETLPSQSQRLDADVEHIAISAVANTLSEDLRGLRREGTLGRSLSWTKEYEQSAGPDRFLYIQD